MRAVKTAVTKLLDQNIAVERFYRLIKLGAGTALEVAPFIIRVMALRLDIGKDADVCEIFSFGRVEIDHWH